MRSFTTAREREAYEQSLRDEDQKLWRSKIKQLQEGRTRESRAIIAARRIRDEQERINRALDASPSVVPIQYKNGERKDEPKGYMGRNGYRRTTTSGSDHAHLNQ